MQTVQIVAIVVAAVGILAIAYLLRERLTRLVVKFGNRSVEVEAAPPPPPAPPPTLAGKGLALDQTTIKKSKINIHDSTMVAQKSKVKGADIEVTETPAPDEDD